ncbi:MAG: GtrA family protein [Candidatus Staskawiczbacteria bacterium]|jgi:putative flippase GtrA
MRLVDIIITIVCGEALALVVEDILQDYSVNTDIIIWFLLFIAPVLAVVGLWFADYISKKLTFIYQFAKYLLVGTFTTFIDLKIFDVLTSAIGLNVGIISGVAKGLSFLISVIVKFIGNKLWVFEDHEKSSLAREFVSFIIVTFIGLIFDVGGFFFFAKILGPQFGMPEAAWVKVSVILAAILAAIWNFLSYKFLVFKKVVKVEEINSEIN